MEKREPDSYYCCTQQSGTTVLPASTVDSGEDTKCDISKTQKVQYLYENFIIGFVLSFLAVLSTKPVNTWCHDPFWKERKCHLWGFLVKFASCLLVFWVQFYPNIESNSVGFKFSLGCFISERFQTFYQMDSNEIVGLIVMNYPL